MTLSSPKKYVSKFTSCTMNRGVEAKENGTARLDMSLSTTGAPGESSRGSEGGGGDRDTPPATDETASYIQVVVHKHRSRRPPGVSAQTSPRRPDASSPLPQLHHQHKSQPEPCPETGGYYMMPPPMLLTLPHSHHYPWMGGNGRGGGDYVEAGTSARSSSSFKKVLRSSRTRGAHAHNDSQTQDAQVDKNPSIWSFCAYNQEDDSNDESPARVEVFVFERGVGAYLGSALPAFGAIERCTHRATRGLDRALHAALALPHCILSAPVLIYLHILRMWCSLVSTVVTGTGAAVGDSLVKPVLAAVHNGLVHPPLVCLHNVLGALRDALRPLVGLLTDLTEPPARLLSAVRLVSVAPPAPRP